MRSKFKWIFTLLVALTMQLSFAQEKTVKGIVTDASGPMPGVNIVVKGTQRGVSTGFDGAYSIKASEGEVLVFSFMGMNDIVRTVDASSVVNVKMQEDAKKLETVVITAQGIKTSSKKTTAAMQEVRAKDLNITQSNDLRASLAGKVAGLQNVGQAGSKLGSAGILRLRGGAMSLDGRDKDVLYVIDGVISSADLVDPENVESINVLKGPNASALYGSEGINGVIMITTKKGKKESVSVELYNSTTFDKVAYLPKYQNSYGGGYSGDDSWIVGGLNSTFVFDPSYHPAEWAAMPAGIRYNQEADADESWGPRFDGGTYFPWYTWQPSSPYFAQPQAYVAQPDNVKNFYDTGMNIKNGVTLSGGGDKFTARLNFTKSTQSGVVPTSKFNKDLLSASFSSDVTSRLKLGMNVTYSKSTAIGDFDDEYGNQTSGSFNSWFNRDLDTDKLRELKDLKNSKGYAASWNYWMADYYDPAYGLTANDAVYKNVFWRNPYFYLDNYQPETVNDRLLADINASYKVNKNINFNLIASKNYRRNTFNWKVPFALEYNSAHNFYTDDVNSFGTRNLITNTNTLQSSLDFTYNLNSNLVIKETIGHIWRDNTADQINSDMRANGNILAGTQVGLVIPDLYTFENSRQRVNAQRISVLSRLNTFYSRTNLDYKNFLSLNLDVMYELNSKFDYSGQNNSNNIPYGSFGASFIFSELIKAEVLNSGKIFASVAKTAPEVDAGVLNPAYGVSQTSNYLGNPLMFTSTNVVAPNLKPFASPSIEIGTDLKFANNRIRFNGVAYKEVRENQIIPIGISATTGFLNIINRSGKTTKKGVEIVLGLTPVKRDKFSWDMTLNFGKNESMVDAVAPGTNAFQIDQAAFSGISFVNYTGEEWGQLVGKGILRDASGNKVLNSASGLYVTQDNVKFGSVLPDFTGGLVNRFEFGNFTLAGTLGFQKGGQFFSLSERWGQFSGLLEETAAINDRGANVRDTPYNPSAPVVGEDGGVHVVGVDETGAPVDTYVAATDYFKQFHNNNIAEGFVHDASYIKLSDVSLSYNLPGKWFSNKIQGISVGLIGRNLARFGLNKDNKHGWDSSEMSKQWGENGQLPGTKSYGFNVKLTL